MSGGLALAPVVGVRARTTVATAVVAARVLAMSTDRLRETITAEAGVNPALVVRERPLCPGCGRRAGRGCCGRARAQAPEPEERPSGCRRLWMDAVAAAPAGLRDLVVAVVASLDERGLFPAAARDALTGDDPAALERAVDVVRSVGPPGTAEADVVGALSAQLDHAPLSHGERDLARRLLTTHRAAFESGDLAGIAAVEGVAAPVLGALVSRLSRLLRPFPRFTGVPAVPVVPDLVFGVEAGRVLVSVTEAEAWEVRVDPTVADPGAVRSARTVADRVRRRWAVLRGLGDLLARRHRAALLGGSTVFGGLNQARAARELGVHESTVSRAVGGRAARLPDGRVIALRSMFGGNDGVRALVAELCAGDPRPSDRVITELLADRGIVISRRTVAKYRLTNPGS